MKIHIILLASLAGIVLTACSHAPQAYTWEKFVMDGHRTGVTIPSADNVGKSIGVVTDGIYTAPNGRVFKGGSTTKAAGLLLEVQPRMAALKEVVANSEKGLYSYRPESPLSNFIADNLASYVAKETGKKVDVAITNFGGIRCDIPAGPVLKDNVVSMLPFRNYATWVQIQGIDLRALFERMAADGAQCVSGARVVVREGRLESVLVGGKPIQDNKQYGVATIDFLLDGGDGYKIARNSTGLVITETKIGDLIMDAVRRLGASGKSLDYACDGRFKVYGTPQKATGTITEGAVPGTADPIEAPKGKPRLVIMHCNDTHSHLDPVPTTSGLRGGIIERAAFVDSIRCSYSPYKILLLHAGDFNQGTSYYSEMHGELEAKLANAMKYDCITLGNHELDDGVESLAARIATIKAKVVCANCVFPDTLQRHVSPYAIFDRGGMKIGIIGMESDIATMVAAPIADRIRQYDNVETVNKWAPYLKESEGCDMVILLSHMGYEEDQTLIPYVSGVDLVIGGHSHTFVDGLLYVADVTGKQVPIITDGCWGLEMGLVKVY